MMGGDMYQFSMPELGIVWAFLGARVLYVVAVASAAFVIVVSVCRLTVICPRTTTLYTWAAMYVGLAALSLWVLLLLLTTNEITTREQFICLLAASYLALTRASWEHGVPKVARKPGVKA